MRAYAVGDVVDITIKGARVTEWDEANDNLTVEYETNLGHYESGFAVDSGSFFVTRVMPAEWPPQPGDLWCNRKGVPWFAVATATGVRLTSKGGVESLPDDVLRERGPLALVHREETP